MRSNAQLLSRLGIFSIALSCMALLVSCSPDEPAFNETETAFDTMEPTASGIVQAINETDREFTPTHTVKARLNLRPSASLSTMPITVLKVGAQVEYISEIDDWYYVNTEFNGKGWCSSNYLSSLKH
ncbi:MAG: SH3 domain-containing protein [Gammaproteobacteria bacterium]|nr:SH3 domain-containing protein [Gammaproteobacteria bacterium]